MAEEELKRQSAVYNDTRNRSRHSRTDLSDEQIDAIALQAVEAAVFGHDAKKDRNGNFVQQGIGHKGGGETINSLMALKKWEGVEAYNRECARIWRETPDHAKKLGLPQPTRT
jgi:hypothetical protein